MVSFMNIQGCFYKVRFIEVPGIWFRLAMVIVLVAAGSACQEASNDASQEHPAGSSPETGFVEDAAAFDDSPVLAKVNGHPVTELDVELTIVRTFSQAEQMLLNDDIRQKTLESMVASKAMQLVAEKELTDDDLALIRKQTAAYEEELLVKAYLEQVVSPTPVSTKMVEDYYRQNPERFGAKTVKQYELLRTRTVPTETQRDGLLANVNTIRNTRVWHEKQAEWQTLYGLFYRQGELLDGLLDPEIEQVIQRLEAGDVSDVVYIKGIPFIMRVTGTREQAPKPLSEVSGEIRKMLAPQQMRKAVRAVMDSVIANAEIEYINDEL